MHVKELTCYTGYILKPFNKVPWLFTHRPYFHWINLKNNSVCVSVLWCLKKNLCMIFKTTLFRNYFFFLTWTAISENMYNLKGGFKIMIQWLTFPIKRKIHPSFLLPSHNWKQLLILNANNSSLFEAAKILKIFFKKKSADTQVHRWLCITYLLHNLLLDIKK